MTIGGGIKRANNPNADNEEEGVCKKTKSSQSVNSFSLHTTFTTGTTSTITSTPPEVTCTNLANNHQDDDDDDILNDNCADGYNVKPRKWNEDVNFEQEMKQILEYRDDWRNTMNERKLNQEIEDLIAAYTPPVSTDLTTINNKNEDEPAAGPSTLDCIELDLFNKTFDKEYRRFLLCDMSDIGKTCQLVEEIETTLLDDCFLMEDKFTAKFCFEKLKSITRFNTTNTTNNTSTINTTNDTATTPVDTNTTESTTVGEKENSIQGVDLKLSKWRKICEILFNKGVKGLISGEFQSMCKSLLLVVSKFALNNLVFSSYHRGVNTKYSKDEWQDNRTAATRDDSEDNDDVDETELNSPTQRHTDLELHNHHYHYFQIDMSTVSFIFSLLDKDQKNQLVTSFIDDFGFEAGENDAISDDEDFANTIARFYPLLFFKSITNMCCVWPQIHLVITKILLVIVRNSLNLGNEFPTNRILDIEIVDGKYRDEDQIFLESMLKGTLKKLDSIVGRDLHSVYFFMVVTGFLRVAIKSTTLDSNELDQYEKGFRYHKSRLSIFNYTNNKKVILDEN